MALEIMTAGDVLILPTVVMEAEWVLRSRYRVTRRDIADGLMTILGQEGVFVPSAAAVATALAAYGESGDFADLLHFALASESGATAFLTFDRTFEHSVEGGTELQIV
jgi:predicted nucleic-acid-binding protein